MTLNAAGGNIQVSNAATTLTLNGPISGTGSLTKAGPGNLGLASANNTYTGTTYVTAGGIVIGAGNNQAGLYEGLVNNAVNGADWTSPIPQTSIQPVARWGSGTVTQPLVSQTAPRAALECISLLADNTTWGYSGYLDNTSSGAVTYTFGKNFDDNGFLIIDGVSVISNTTWNNT